MKHFGRFETTESVFQESPVKLNEYSCYFIEEDISYRGVIGGFDIDKIFEDGRDEIETA